MTVDSRGPGSVRTLRVLVVDDETSARRRLLALLADEPGVEVVGESVNGLAACADVLRLSPDLVFLDMEMPERSGLDVVAHLGAARMPATIFVTAYGHYAIDAFEANAVDYLLKPFDEARFRRAMAKARAASGVGRRATDAMTAALAAVAPAPAAPALPDRLWVRQGEAREPVKVADIRLVSAEGNYVRLHAQGGDYLMRETLSGLLERLDPARFRRVHRSHVVNIEHVTKLLPWFGGDCLVMLSDGRRVTMSRSYRGALDNAR